MYLFDKKNNQPEAEKKKINSVSCYSKEKQSNEVRFSNVVQKNIVRKDGKFVADKNRIAINTIPVSTGMDRSHTVSDRVVQEAVACFMNGEIEINAFYEFCIKTAGTDATNAIIEDITALSQTLNSQSFNETEALQIANKLYAEVANSTYNLRVGGRSGNRSTGQYIDLNGPEIVNVINDYQYLEIKITEVDARNIYGMFEADIDALVRVKGDGAVASSTDSRFGGPSYIYKVIYLESKGDGFVHAYAEKT